MVLSRNERNIRYSIRKFSIGVASVAVCCFFCASVAQAAENEGATQTAVSSRVVEDSLKTQKTKLLSDETEVTDPNELDDIKNAFGQGNNVAPQPGGQPSIPNQVGSESMPPTTSGETGSLTKPKTSNDSMKSLERELKEAKETAKTTLDNYRKSRLTQLNPAAFWFGDLLLASKKTLSEYSEQFDRASSKEEVKALMEKSRQEIDKLIVTHQNREKGNQPVPQPGGTPSGSSTDKPSGTPQAGNQSDKPAPSLSDTKEVQDLIKKGFQELEKLEKSLQELDEKAELPDEEFYGKQKTIWDNQKGTIRKSIKDFKDIVKDIASKYHKENYFKKYNSDFKDYQLYVQMEIMTRQVRDYLLRYPKDGEIIKEFESGMKQTASDNYSNLSGDNLKGYFEKNFRSAFEKIQETVRKLEKKAPAPKTPEKPQKSEQPKPSKPTEKDTNSSGSPSPGKKAQEVPQKQDKVAEAQKKVAEAEKKAKVQKEEDSRNYPTNTRKTIELEIAEAKVGVAKAELELAQAETQTPQDTDKINTAKAKVETAKSKVETLEKIKAGHGRPQAGDQKPSMPAPDTKPNHQSQPESPRPDTNPAGDKRPSSEPTPTPRPEGKQPSTPKEPENKKPSLPSPEKPKNSKIFTATDGKTKVTVMFEHSVDVGKVNIKEVISKDLVATITHKAGGGVVRVFELFLSKNGKETHVNGERTVRLTLGQTGSGVQVYHVKENGELEPIPSKVENGDIVFKTTHFSLFAVKILSQKQDASMPGQDTPPTRAGKTQTKDTKPGKSQDKGMNHTPVGTSKGAVKKGNSKPVNGKKSLPYTGTASHLVLEILGLLSLTATAVFAKKRRK